MTTENINRAHLLTEITTLRAQIRLYAEHIAAGANLEKYASLIAYAHGQLIDALEALEDYDRQHPEDDDNNDIF